MAVMFLDYAFCYIKTEAGSFWSEVNRIFRAEEFFENKFLLFFRNADSFVLDMDFKKIRQDAKRNMDGVFRFGVADSVVNDIVNGDVKFLFVGAYVRR